MRKQVPAFVAVAFAALLVGAGVTAAVAMDGPADPGQADVQSPDQPDADSPDVDSPGQTDSHAPGQSSGAQTVSVSASGSAQTTPDQVTVRVAVVETGEDAPTVRENLAENVSQMRSALAEIGVSDDQIQTNRYDLDQDYRRPPRPDEEPQRQYRGEHSFVITVSDLDKTGQIIDTAVENGATEVEDISFTLSEDERRELRTEALRDGMDNARSQAETLADASELRITGVHSVQTSENVHRIPMEAPVAAADGGGGTDVESGPVNVRVQVQVTYNATQS
jgi:uncharacterized protein YggE